LGREGNPALRFLTGELCGPDRLGHAHPNCACR
jgi:hypothetical protein